jgi:hypothetical protein
MLSGAQAALTSPTRWITTSVTAQQREHVCSSIRSQTGAHIGPRHRDTGLRSILPPIWGGPHAGEASSGRRALFRVPPTRSRSTPSQC